MSTTLTPETVAPDSAVDDARLDDAAPSVGPLTEQPPAEEEVEFAGPPPTSPRVLVAVALPTIAAGVMVGGVFTGIAPRIIAPVAGILGMLVAVGVSRIRRPGVANVVTVAAIFAVGLAMIATAGLEHVFDLGARIAQARADGDVLRPPVPFVPGWRAVVSWVMAMFAFTATWVAIVNRRPATGLLLPLPVAAIAAISVPESQQVASGIIVLVLFALGLGLLSSAEASGDGDDAPPLAFELRRAVRSIPLVAVVVAALVALSTADVLFPDPLIDPTQEPQAPQTVPLSEVEDRILFTKSGCDATGPWRMGSLDVFTGEDWRLPPFAENQLADVPASGVIDESLEPGVACTFETLGLDGVVLPGLPNATGIRTTGPRLAYDGRSGNIRLAEGQLEPGLVYTVQAAKIPSVDDLVALEWLLPADVVPFTSITPAPPGVQALIDQAPTSSKWEQFDFLRTWILDNVVVSGQGVPVGIDGDRVEEMVTADLEGSPFEIVAAQAMMARWIGVPARIGYGFDGGDHDEVDDATLHVRPRHGATFVEVYFPTYKWLPVIGTPRQAKASVDASAEQHTDTTIIPSDEIAVELYLPTVTPPPSVLTEQLRNAVLVAVPIILLLLPAYYLYPALRKAIVRARRRAWANRTGPRARIALAYAEFRDVATDLGVGDPSLTPLGYVDRVVEDEEHLHLAWLVTRTLWGDLARSVNEEHAAHAEELARSMRRRMLQTQPLSMRLVAAISRLSLRAPYAPEIDRARSQVERHQEVLRELAPEPA